ncbi:DUF418 domain-containing protein [Pseudoduganella sp. DS3]|uniref:DUF418 domain-containing protein n=1 Tax=Pseudoduganella guangdongensis TaxID=2692179 RepID=A0A6N9HRB5_9BURK|nr:DUF418 domain-containing protein [Pseudoduganella guangdongensis]MYN05492.1 DUF418 domain-containing protein [Pseudoduganella guangdongensis]
MNQSRLLNVDALRGFALLGILAVNIWAFADPYFRSGASHGASNGALDEALRFLVALLFEGKFYLLFSLLFGYSFSLQMDAARRADADFKARMRRRGLALFALGVLHGCLLFEGDILNTYGLLSLMLLSWRELETQRAVRRALRLLVLPALLLGAIGSSALFIESTAGGRDAGEIAAKLAAFQGSAAATQAYVMAQFPGNLANLPFMGPSSLAMFLLGFVAGRERLLARIDSFRHLLPRVLWICLPVGLVGEAVIAAYGTLHPSLAGGLIGVSANMLVGPFLTLAYIVLLLMLFETRVGARLQAALAPMGRLALSNYLSQSLVLALLFTGYGLGLCNRVPPLGLIGIVLALFGAQMALSAWWLKRNTYGPAEWLLRGITNWNWTSSRLRTE